MIVDPIIAFILVLYIILGGFGLLVWWDSR